MSKQKIIQKLKTILCLSLVFAMFTSNAQAFEFEDNTKIPILMYHDLTTDEDDTDSMTITIERFEEDMAFLSLYGYTPLLAEDLVAISSGEMEMPSRPVMITFDDGYATNYTLGYPIIEEYGMKATVSVITSHMKDDEGNGYPDSLHWTQIQALYESGIIDIGLHTHRLHNEEIDGMQYVDQPNGIQRKEDETLEEYNERVGTDIKTGVEMLEYYLGEDYQVNYFSYPFGATDSWFQPILDENGITVSTTTYKATADIRYSLFHLPRHVVNMENSARDILALEAIAQPQISNISINGGTKQIPTYKIEGEDYIKLRDLAFWVNETSQRFYVGYEDGDIIITSNSFYEKNGNEMQDIGTETQKGTPTVGTILIDGEEFISEAYEINGSHYFNLETLVEALGFTIRYNTSASTIAIATY